MASKSSNDLLEQLAAIEHERWSHWQKYMHEKAHRNDDGSLTLPADLVNRWERLMSTPYEKLTDGERESDRDQVRRYIDILKAQLPASDSL